MKKLSLLVLAVAGLMTACSSDKEGATPNQTDPFNGRQGGFIKVSINLPVQPVVSTRDWEESETGTLADGLAKEYEVKKCILLLFEGDDETSATLKQVEDVSAWNTNVTDDPNQVTTSTTKTVQLLKSPTNNLYALAVVNGEGYIGLASNTSVNVLGEVKSGIKLSDLYAVVHRGSKNFMENGFFMTNAVLSLQKGGTDDPGSVTLHTLAPVDATRIYDSAEDANNAAALPSCDIYVERGVAKVTIDGSDPNYLSVAALKDADGNTYSFSPTMTWAIDNYNEASYLVRNTTGFNGWSLKSHGPAAVDAYRFVGANPVDVGYTQKVSGTGYRTYWAIDPNYSSDWASGLLLTAPESAYSDKVGENNPQYCFENTFDVAHQIHALTTRVVFKVKLNATDFYTIGADKKTLYQLDDVRKKFVTALMGNDAFKSWYNTTETGKGGSTTLTYDKITLTLAAKTYGVVEVEKVKIDKSVLKGGADIEFDDASTVEGHNLSGVITAVNGTVGKVTQYDDGMAYYQIRVKHFGDDLTPWNDGEFTTGNEPKESGINDIYPLSPDQNANYLGRYGMVRNNWYWLKIGAITKIGSATVPEVNRDPTTPPTDPNDPEDPSHPDDELEDAFIKARINILSWAKRVQSWNLR